MGVNSLIDMEEFSDNIQEENTVSSACDWKQFEDTRNRADVLRFLKKQQWQVTDRTFYRHCKDGKVRKNRNGFYTSRMVKKYAETWLTRPSGKTVQQEGEDLLAEKTREEIERIRVDREHRRFKFEVEQKLYLPRADVEAELAGRAIVLDNGLTYLIQANANELIALVGGDQTRSGELVAFLVEKKDRLMNEYAAMGDFVVDIEE